MFADQNEKNFQESEARRRAPFLAMEPVAFKHILPFFHVFLYLPATVLLLRVLLNQVRGRSECGRSTVGQGINPAFFLATLGLLLLSAFFLAYGALLVANRDVLLPHTLQQVVKFGSFFYWFLLACFIAQWGRCFG